MAPEFSRQFLLALANTFLHGVLIVDPSGSILVINQAFEEILQVKEKDVLGMDIQSVVPKCQLKRVMAAGLPSTNNIYKMNGRIYKANYFPLKIEEALLGGVAVFYDITTTEKISSELTAVNTYKSILETILQNVTEGIVVVNKEGNILMFNGAYADFLAVSPEKALGKPVSEVFPDSRLIEVMDKGISDISMIQKIGNHNAVVKSMPIKIDDEVVAGVSNIWFRDLKDMEHLYRQLSSLEDELAYYKEELRRKQGSKYTLHHIIGTSPAITTLKHWIQTAGRSPSTVLILGESGTGKELVAHSIHDSSGRRHQPFVRINCAAIPEAILESELFGYAGGAFTGSQKGGKIGKFEMADKGTVFLDEIGDMSFHMQAKLLRFLQEKEFERLGENKMRQVDVRVIAATNQNLAQKIIDGTFREDLFYRLQVITIDMPPLRQHKEDIPLLFSHFVEKYSRELLLPPPQIAPQSMALLEAYHWPGNVRQLENAAERACNLLGSRGEITPDMLPSYLQQPAVAAAIPEGNSFDLSANRQEAEKASVLLALEKCGGNRTQAAKLLGITRTALYQKLKKHQIG